MRKRTLVLVIGIVAASVFVAGTIVFVVQRVRAVADGTLVTVATSCIGAGHSPSHESVSCAGTPRLRIVVDGRDETSEGTVRMLRHGADVAVTTSAVEDGATLECSISNHGVVLVTKRAADEVTCRARVP